MKRLIITEGANDLILSKNILIKERLVDKNKILTFNQETTDKYDMLNHEQTRYLKTLKKEHGGYEILIKSEGGKLKVFKLINHRIIHICKERYYPIILIDLDGNKIDKYIKKIEEDMSNTYKYPIKIKEGITEKTSDAQLIELKLEINNSPNIYKLYLIGFNESLEKATNITEEDETLPKEKKEKTILKKINKYIEESDIKDIFNICFDKEVLQS